MSLSRPVVDRLWWMLWRASCPARGCFRQFVHVSRACLRSFRHAHASRMKRGGSALPRPPACLMEDVQDTACASNHDMGNLADALAPVSEVTARARQGSHQSPAKPKRQRGLAEIQVAFLTRSAQSPIACPRNDYYRLGRPLCEPLDRFTLNLFEQLDILPNLPHPCMYARARRLRGGRCWRACSMLRAAWSPTEIASHWRWGISLAWVMQRNSSTLNRSKDVPNATTQM